MPQRAQRCVFALFVLQHAVHLQSTAEYAISALIKARKFSSREWCLDRTPNTLLNSDGGRVLEPLRCRCQSSRALALLRRSLRLEEVVLLGDQKERKEQLNATNHKPPSPSRCPAPC